MKRKSGISARHANTPVRADDRALVKRLVILARNVNSTNRGLLGAAADVGLAALVLPPEHAARQLGAGDVALGRLDVLPTLNGPEPGLETLRNLEQLGVPVLNRAGPLLATHDKLMTALRLATRGVPHPRTAHVDTAVDPTFGFPVVVKPRFGSWGRDVVLCRDRPSFERCLRSLSRKPWFRHQGALVQELIEPQGYDLRIVVAAGEVVGAIKRVSAPGEWRTNISLGGRRTAADPSPQARLIALGAAAALGTDFVGVDLLPDRNGGWVVLELNGAVDFTTAYSLGGESVFGRVVQTLTRSIRGKTEVGPVRVSELAGGQSRDPAIPWTANAAESYSSAPPRASPVVSSSTNSQNRAISSSVLK
jgi:RimK family alpha-L-glutamate ligase